MPFKLNNPMFPCSNHSIPVRASRLCDLLDQLLGLQCPDLFKHLVPELRTHSFV